MNLYRATYTLRAAVHVRHMTYAAAAPGEALQFAQQWALQDKLNSVVCLRTKQVLLPIEV